MTAASATPGLIRRRVGRLRTGALGGWLNIVALAVLTVFVLAAVFADVVSPVGPNDVSLSDTLAPISGEHLLGADQSGRDTLSRLIYGARGSLLGPLAVVAGSTLLGTAFGVWAAWRGGVVDWLISRSTEVVFAFPGLLLAILAVAMIGPGLTAPVVAMVIAYTPYIARLSRSAALQEAAKPYIAAYRVQGFSSLTIVARHLVPNIVPLLLAQSTLNFGYALLDLAALSYLGFGVQPPTPDWGTMIRENQQAVLEGVWQPSLVPGVCIVLVVVAFTTLGEAIADRVARRDVP
ncbi:ABC transporter permease [Micromonospora phytophila]|uniref:ABC transporter permease n=1 Tax=Micromonospora phytophila TaxID=709888 RepID=UPI00202FA46C|nr:ABC transporter permease [Micromonospora phytophila]MCM0673310.1 ABC transporter permease [Micromonospora phytophila]